MGNNIKFYLSEYNEEAWNRYSKSFKKNNLLYKFTENVPEDILNVLIGLLGVDGTRSWIYKELRQLESKTVLQLVKDDQEIKALKAFIMRMPN